MVSFGGFLSGTTHFRTLIIGFLESCVGYHTNAVLKSLIL